MIKQQSSLRKFIQAKGRIVIITSIRWYQKWISSPSGLLTSLGLKRGRVCVFEPSCSEYAITAIEKYGIFHGGVLSLRRILRCHPWQKTRYDPVK